MCAKIGKKEDNKYLVLLKGENDTIYVVSRRDSIFRENLLSVFSGEKHYNYFIGTIFDLLDKALIKFSPALNYLEMHPVLVSISDFNKKLIATTPHNFYTCYKDEGIHVGMLKLKKSQKAVSMYNKGIKIDTSIPRSMLNINNYNEDFDAEEYINDNPGLAPQFVDFYGISIS